jgi:LacI family transcriptional regulator
MTTIHDVAKKCGVSAATVSHVINGTREVAPETADKIRRTIEELDYQPNAAARSLRTRRTGVVGILVTDITNPFFASLVRGAEDTASESGLAVIVCNSGESAAREQQYVRLLRQRRVDGLIMSPVGDGSSDCIRSIARSKTPLVFVDRKPVAINGDAVLSNNLDGAEKATQYLVDRGHSRIGLIIGIPGVTTTEERLEGYRRVLERSDIPLDEDLIQYGSYRIEGGRGAANALLRMSEPPTALFGTNNLMTIGLLKEILCRGLTVPDDVAVVGFDEIALGDLARPRLTTVCQHPAEIGEQAMRLLIERIHGASRDANREIRIPVELRVRESA